MTVIGAVVGLGTGHCQGARRSRPKAYPKRDRRGRDLDLDESKQSIRIVALVCDDRIGLDAYAPTGVALGIDDLTRTQYHSQQIAQSIHYDVNVAAQSTARAPELSMQIAPRTTGVRYPGHFLNELPLILAGMPLITILTGQHRFQARPLVFTQASTNHPDLP